MGVPEAILDVPEAILEVTEAILDVSVTILDVPEAILCKNENKSNSAQLWVNFQHLRSGFTKLLFLIVKLKYKLK
jgi:hypothetical protein